MTSFITAEITLSNDPRTHVVTLVSFAVVNLFFTSVKPGLKVREARDSVPTSEMSPTTSDVSPSTSQYSPLTLNHSPIIPLGSSPVYDYNNLDKNYVGYCVFVSVPEMQVPCVEIQVISASRLFDGLDPAVAKALSPTFIKQMVILACSA
jgi:hypothetical protein